MALNCCGRDNKGEPWARAIAFLREHYSGSRQIRQLSGFLCQANDEATDALIYEVIAKNPDRKVQATFCKALARARHNLADGAAQLEEKYGNHLDRLLGKDAAIKLESKSREFAKEAATLDKLLQEKYGDVFLDLSVGKIAPEVVSKDLDGNEVRLTSLRGKVVVLDIWTTWCGPCRAMIPHERELVERLKDKPFVLVSISADKEKKALTDFLAKEKMPWTHWYNGIEGGMVEDWEISGFPTIFVLDARGTIRFKNVRGKQLEEAVEQLLKEMPQARK